MKNYARLSLAAFVLVAGAVAAFSVAPVSAVDLSANYFSQDLVTVGKPADDAKLSDWEFTTRERPAKCRQGR